MNKYCLTLLCLSCLFMATPIELGAAESVIPLPVVQTKKSQSKAEAIMQAPEAVQAETADNSSQAADKADVKEPEQTQQQKVFLQALRKKLKLPLPEVVRIQEVDYLVPEPWAGNRVKVPYDTAENLALIPTELTLDGMEIALRKEAIAQLERMAAAAKEDGIRLQVDSGYRSAAYQRDIYERKMEEGQSFERIARHTAPPGYSGHALGTAVDFHPSGSGFHKTKAYRWLKQHAKNYGFHETYFKGNAFGMTWEPWHWEYRLKKKKSAETTTAQPEAKSATEENTDLETTNAQPALTTAEQSAKGEKE